MVLVAGLEPARYCYHGIFVLLYVTIAALLRCSLDYVFTISFLTQVVGVQSLHILFMLLSNIKFLARRSVSAFAVQPTSTLRVSPQALSAAVAAVSQCWKKTHKSPGCLPIPPHEHINKTFVFGLVAFANSAIPLYLAGEPRFELGSQ